MMKNFGGNSGIRAHRRLLMYFFLIAFVFCTPFAQAHPSPFTERLSYISHACYNDGYDFSDFDWMKRRLGIKYLFDYKTGSEFISRLSRGCDFLDFLANLEIQDDADKQKLRSCLLQTLEEYLNHPLIVELFKDLAKRNRGEIYDYSAKNFPLYLARTIMKHDPSPDELKLMWEMFQNVQEVGRKNYYTIGFLKLLFFFNTPEATYQYCSMLPENSFEEKTYYSYHLSRLKSVSFIKTHGFSAFIDSVIADYSKKPQLITNQKEFYNFWEEKCFFSYGYYYDYIALDRETLRGVFSKKERTPAEKLLIITVGLELIGSSNPFIPNEYEDYLSKNAEMEQDKTTEFLYRSAVTACKNARTRVKHFEEQKAREKEREARERERERE